ITVQVIGDTLDESDETFTMQLSGASGADIIDGAGAGLILDDDGVSSLVVDDQTVLEGNSGTRDAVFTVTLSPASPQQVTVNYATANGTATAGVDFDAASGSLVFAPGQTVKTVAVHVRGDTIDEGVEETFTLALSNPQNANIADGSGAGVITDDDSAILSLAGQPSVLEGNSGLRPANFTVSLSLATSFAVTVDYHTGAVVGSGHATPDVDFVSANGTLTFQPGQTLKTVAVNVIGDVVVETDEDFFLEISNGTVATAGSHATGVILNDDLGSRFIYVPLVLR
ncbi:MAG TPA: Calx-beta domain-containing protein, partial [Anaerolineae bacterium]|nr:Calx-beta domain-containing protein [Anaerolineae bacterium]